MYRALIVTPWGLDAAGARHPKLFLVGLPFERLDDVTGQDAAVVPPTPNAYTVAVTGEAAALEAIAAHPDGYVELYREEVPA